LSKNPQPPERGLFGSELNRNMQMKYHLLLTILQSPPVRGILGVFVNEKPL
jgi:hypothetical protein